MFNQATYDEKGATQTKAEDGIHIFVLGQVES